MRCARQTKSTNQIEVANSIGNTNVWTTLTTVVFTQSPQIWYDTISPPNVQRYYRAVVQGGSLPVAPAGFVWLPGGRFTMGSPDTQEDRRSDEEPQTEVTLTHGFYICHHEVTQGEYLAVTDSNPSYFTGDTNRPVEQVTWFEATNYCGQLTLQERAAGRIPTNWVYRLPTEAEWEDACRAGTTNRFYYGDDPGYTLLGHHSLARHSPLCFPSLRSCPRAFPALAPPESPPDHAELSLVDLALACVRQTRAQAAPLRGEFHRGAAPLIQQP